MILLLLLREDPKIHHLQLREVFFFLNLHQNQKNKLITMTFKMSSRHNNQNRKSKRKKNHKKI